MSGEDLLICQMQILSLLRCGQAAVKTVWK
uniref:Uncharacterized protein n=1 Tax=Rhizophora mucronata TaxID=61149 RepID=A0A2P2JQT8_RHIMU